MKFPTVQQKNIVIPGAAESFISSSCEAIRRMVCTGSGEILRSQYFALTHFVRAKTVPQNDVRGGKKTGFRDDERYWRVK